MNKTSTKAGRTGRITAAVAATAFSALCVLASAPAFVGSAQAASSRVAAYSGATITIDGVKYPDPLTLKSGTKVTSTSVWENSRRAEILADFRQNVYGQNFSGNYTQTFSVATTNFTNVKRKIVTVRIAAPYATVSYPVRTFIPTNQAVKGTFLMIDHRAAATDDPAQNTDYLPVARLNAAGYAIAIINANDVAPDNNSSYRSKMINAFYKSSSALPDNAMRAVGTWSWSASRAMDYLVTDSDIDASKVAVIGHSRSGKAALWAGAQDTRFAAVISNESGNTGAKLARRGAAGVNAETVAAINNNFPYWFAQTYKAYNGNESSLPVDQHELMDLVAPRRVYIASAQGDNNSDPKGEFLAYTAASQVYGLYGIGNNGLPSNTWQPALNTPYRGDAMSYHLRSGSHDLNYVDWGFYMNGDVFNRSAPTQ